MHTIPPFRLERYFAQYEFKARYLLSASDCESLTMQELLDLADPDSLRRWHSLSLGYTESQGLPALREEVAALYPGITADDVLILSPEEGIYIAMTTLLEPGDHVIVVSPAYQSLQEIARSRGCEVTPWLVHPDERGWHADMNELAAAITERTRLLVLNFPHNPTGSLLSVEDWAAVHELSAQHNLIVFSDEMYRLLEYDAAARLPAACAQSERGISLSGLSKSLALPGLRLGWLATRNRTVLKRFQYYRDYTTICNSAPSEILGIMALRVCDQLVRRNLKIIAENLAHVQAFFDEFPQWFRWRSPAAGSVAFVEWKGAQPVERFCRDVLDACGVMIVPGAMFDMPGSYFRLGLGRRNFSKALAEVQAWLHSDAAKSIIRGGGH